MKLKLTKNELKKQKDNLKRFERYLPNLQLKKQQLQMEMQRIHKKMDDCENEIAKRTQEIEPWIDVFAEKHDLQTLVQIHEIITRSNNIAGVEIPVLEKITFKERHYSLHSAPLWYDFGVTALETMMTLKTTMRILEQQLSAIREELRIVTQRVNLFEKIKIPESKINIRKIRINLGDMQTAAVVTGKIAKNKLDRAEKAEVFA